MFVDFSQSGESARGRALLFDVTVAAGSLALVWWKPDDPRACIVNFL